MTTKKTAVITGATSGLGEEAALALARQGWRVIVTGRDAARGAEVVTRAKGLGGEAEFVAGDLFTAAGVKALARAIRERAPALDLLVNNAGGTFRAHSVTADGLERTVALNVMAPHVLTEELIDALAAARGRVVNVVTGVPHGARATVDQLVGEKADAGMGAYVRAKLALLALTRAQQERYGARGVTVAALHPGVVPDTRFGQEMPGLFRAIGPFVAKLFGIASSRETVAGRYVRVGTGDVERGGFYREDKLSPLPAQAQDARFADELWSRLDAVAARSTPPA